MNPLPGHVLDTYEDRKPNISSIPPAFANAKYNPPQFYQTTGASIAGTHAGPLRSISGPMEGTGQAGVGGEGEEGSWMSTHGLPWWMAPQREMPSRLTPWSEEKLAQLQVRLARRLGPEYLATRPGPGGGPKLTYIEGWKVINLANEVFGFNGWSSEIRSLHTDFLDTNANGRCSIAVTAHIRITLADGAFHEDIGLGSGENLKGKAAALEKAKKEAVTDAMKRALRSFGNLLGNCLYDKDYCKEVTKMRVVPVKFNPDELERRPEFAPPPRPAPPPNAAAGPSRQPAPPAQAHARPAHQQNQPQAQVAAVPQRMQREGTPIRSIHDMDTTVGTVDENFDAEFMEASFFDDMDMSVVDGAQAESHVVTNGTNGANPPSANTAPAYQHRHRPDPPPAPNPPASREAGGSGGTSRRNSQDTTGAGFQRSLSSNGQVNGAQDAATIAAPPKVRGGFNFPAANGSNGPGPKDPAAAAAAAARREAMRSALTNGNPNVAATSAPSSNSSKSNDSHHAQNKPAVAPSSRSAPTTSAYTTPHRPSLHLHAHAHAQHSGPIRAESPSIPQGGIDTAAARAAAQYRAQAAKLELDVPGAEMGMSIQGFSSARGIKRVSEEMSASPTKDRGQGQGQGQQGGGGMIRRNGNGPRQALGELSLEEEEEGQKRHRAV